MFSFGNRRILEKNVEEYLQINGYEVLKNVVVDGKSGRKNEIDLLAVKSDAITKIKILFEFVSWNRTIGNNVVLKVFNIMNDIGANKSVIISFNLKYGFSKKAKDVAKKLSVDLWNREELNKRFETVKTFSQLYPLEATEETILTLSSKIEKDDVVKIVMKTKNVNEKLEFTRFVYLPCYLLQFTYTVKRGLIRKKSNVMVDWSLCESIEGTHYPVHSNVRFIDIHFETFNSNVLIITPKLNSMRIRKEIEAAYSKLEKNVKSSILPNLQYPLGNLEGEPKIHNIKKIYYPFFVTLLKEKNEMKWFVIDGYTSLPAEEMSKIFNRNFSYINKFISN